MQDTSYDAIVAPKKGAARSTTEELRRFSRLEKLQKEYEPFRKSPQLMAAPHPVRIAATPMARHETVLVTCAEPENQDFVLEKLKSGLSTVNIYRALDRKHDGRIKKFLDMYEAVGAEQGGFGGGAAGAMMHAARFEVTNGAIYSLSDDLVEMLDSTDLGTDIPLDELKLPAPNIYLQLGINRDRARHHLYNGSSGTHALEGAYLSMVEGDGTRFIEVTLTGSPLGKTELLDDAVEWAQLEVTPGVAIRAAIENAFMRSVRATDPIEAAEQQRALREHAAGLGSMLELVVKALLFLGMPEARTTRSDAGTQARKVLARTVSGAHRRKALKSAAFSYDCILVDGPEPASEEERAARASGAMRASHWRRGHFRHQRHGQGLSLTKVMWIRPTYVRPGQGDEEAG